MEIDELVSNIENWVNNDFVAKIKTSREQYDPIKYPFLLRIQRSNPTMADIPLFVFKPIEYKDKVGIYSGITFNSEQQQSFNALDPNYKNQVMLDLSEGLLMMNLIVNFYPNKLDFKQIAFQEMIYFDGLSKDRIMGAIAKVVTAYGYVITILQKYNILREGFDPSSFV